MLPDSFHVPRRNLFSRIFIFWLACYSSLAAQSANGSTKSAWDLIGGDASSFMNDAGHIFSSPLRFNVNDWLVSGAVLATTASCFTIDQSVRDFAQRQQGSSVDAFMAVGRTYGNAEFALAIAGTVYVGGLAIGDDDIRVTGLELVESVAFAGLVTSSFKVILGRSRPYTGDGPFSYKVFRWDERSWSLPSGHATVAFAVSSVFASRFDNTWTSIGFYGLAGLTSFSRVYHDAHWTSDVFLGSVIGAVIGTAVVSRHTPTPKDASWRLTPRIGGFNLTVEF